MIKISTAEIESLRSLAPHPEDCRVVVFVEVHVGKLQLAGLLARDLLSLLEGDTYFLEYTKRDDLPDYLYDFVEYAEDDLNIEEIRISAVDF